MYTPPPRSLFQIVVNTIKSKSDDYAKGTFDNIAAITPNAQRVVIIYSQTPQAYIQMAGSGLG